MSLMTTQNTFRDVVNASVRALFNLARDEQSANLYAKDVGFSMDDPDVPEAQISSISGPGAGSLTVEGQQYGSNNKYRGYPMTLVLNKYTTELSWTEEDLHWINKQGSSKKRSTLTSAASEAVQGLYQNYNQDVSKLFYFGFGTTFLTGGNSEALFASHTVRKTGTGQRNTFASGATHRPFSADAFSDAITIMNRLRGHNDIELTPVKRARVLCSKENAPNVIQTLESLYGPNNANLGLSTGSKEFMQKRGIAVDHFVLADMPTAYQNYWFVIDMDRMASRTFLAEAWGPRMNDETDYSKGTFSNEASALFGWYWNEATWCFGSIGDNSTI